MSAVLPYLRCYDCRLHVLDALAADEHRRSTGHDRWTCVLHELHPPEEAS